MLFLLYLFYLSLDTFSLILIFEFEHFTLPLCSLIKILHRFYSSSHHFSLRMLHDLPFDLFIGNASFANRFLTRNIDPNVVVHCQFSKEEGLGDVIVCFYCVF